MAEAQALARTQQQLEELCAASIRALAHQTDLHFRGRRLHRGRKRLPLYAPHLHPSPEHDDLASYRGAADGLALRLRLSDDALHRARLPAAPVQRLLFDLLEQYRVESLAGDAWPGVRHNIERRQARWTDGFLASRLHETARGLLLFAVAQTLRARVFGLPLPEALDELVEGTRFRLAPTLGPDLVQLRRLRGDQAAFADVALRLAEGVAHELAALGDGAEALDADREAGADGDERLAFGFLLELDDAEEADAPAVVVTGRSRVLEGSADGYRVWTTEWDRERRPAATMRRDELDQFRTQLDARVAAQAVNLARLARQLRALLARPEHDDWDHAQEEGLVDGRRLAQLVASPTERRLFRQPRLVPRADAVLAFLVDCTGSMRPHAPTVATLMDVMARALDMAGVACEVLGFSTGAWNGGRAARDWQKAGSPAHPGRLAELQHLVFKDGDTAWRHARRDLAAMLRPDLYREGVDGEALQWAATRLRARSEPRKLLVVVSDGCPMESATQRANDAHYLDHHLQQVAVDLEAEGDVELAALGFGLDLSPYYGRCQAVDPDAATGMSVFHDVIDLIGRRSRR